MGFTWPQYKKFRRKITLSATIKFGVTVLSSYVILFVMVLISMYVWNFNGAYTQGYTFDKLNFQKQQLIRQIERQQLQISRAKSLHNVKERAERLFMVSAPLPHYVQPTKMVAQNNN